MGVLDAREPLGGGRQGSVVDDAAGEALGLDRSGDALDKAADRRLAGRDEAENRGVRSGGIAVARSGQHDLTQFRHQGGLGTRGLEKGVARQGDHVAVAQGHHIGHVGCAGQHGHFADWITGFDDADELRPASVVVAEHAQPPGAQQVEGVGGVARREQSLAPRQGEPTGARVLCALEDPREGGFQRVGRRVGTFSGHERGLGRNPFDRKADASHRRGSLLNLGACPS
ncbi:hypothetical protein D3C81_1424770 [compost metagenome]